MFYSETSSSRYSYVAMILHWVMAALILFMIWLGWNMDDNEAGYQIHKSVGITILVLTVSRLLWRWANPPPSLPEGISPGEARLSHVVHVAFYALMITMPLVGWLMVSVSPFQIKTVLFGFIPWPHIPFTSGLQGETLYGVLEAIHGFGAWSFLVMLALHIAGALKHQFIGDRRPVLPRMIPKVFGDAEAPTYLSRGAQFVFGAPVAIFALLAIATAFTRANPPSRSTVIAQTEAVLPDGPRAQDADAKDINANWKVDFAKSEIRFTGQHDGGDFTGVFKDWDARVAFYPEDLLQSVVIVNVDMNSATTGKKLYDDTIQIEEWFDIQNYPQSVVRLTNFRKQADKYVADATLVLKGAAHTVPLTFTLTGEGANTTLKGEAEYSRKALNLGQTSDPSGGWVSDLIKVTVTGKATRTDTPETDVSVSVSDAQTVQPRTVVTAEPQPVRSIPVMKPATARTVPAPTPVTRPAANPAAKPAVTPAAKPVPVVEPKPPAAEDAAAPSVILPATETPEAPEPRPAVVDPPPVMDAYLLEQIRKAQEDNSAPPAP